MGEQMARALGAGGPMTVTIAGKECTVRPLGIQELTEVERECVRRYKRGYLETFSQNMDLLPAGDGAKLLEKKLEEVAKWDVGDLPPKFASDPSKIKVSKELKEWLTESLDIADPEKGDDLRWQRMAASAIDQGMLTVDEYRKMTGGRSPKIRVPYSNWWITGDYDGMITFVWKCFSGDGVTKEQVMDTLRGNMSLLIDLTREIEHLSTPQVGNGSASQP